jgi:WD40 repeat protein
MDKAVRLWDAETGAARVTLQGHTDPVTSVVFSPTIPLLASVSSEIGILLWHLPEGTPLAILRAIVQKDAASLFTPTGSIDFLGADACFARALAVCRIGPYSFPFDVCEERFYTSGLLAKILVDDLSYLEPEFESTPLACSPSSP